MSARGKPSSEWNFRAWSWTRLTCSSLAFVVHHTGSGDLDRARCLIGRRREARLSPMKKIFAITLLSLAVTSVAVAGSKLSGNFQAKIKGETPPAFNATWVISFKAGGKYTVARNGTIVVRGRDTIVKDRIGFGHETGIYACQGKKIGAATYRWTLKGKRLTLKSLNEHCPGRRIILTASSFTKKR